MLEQEQARRLIHNYNLIYNLSLSPRRINQAFRRYSSGENIILEPALQYLKELWEQAYTVRAAASLIPPLWRPVLLLSLKAGPRFCRVETDGAVLASFDQDLAVIRNSSQWSERCSFLFWYKSLIIEVLFCSFRLIINVFDTFSYISNKLVLEKK